jgi:repressor LexA
MKEIEIKILEFIKQYIKQKQYPPSIKNICDGVGLKSKASVFTYLKRLVIKGYIEKDKGIDRGIRVC